RGIMVLQSWLFNHSCLIILVSSWGGSELGANGGDSARHGAGDEQLVVGRSELRHVGGGRGNLDCDGSGDDVIQGAERRTESTDGALLLFQHRSHTCGGGLTDGDGGLLGGDPGEEGAAVVLACVGKE